VTTKDDGSTPIIIHRIFRTSAGELRHSFSWRCPGCGSHLPGYKPVLSVAAEELANALPSTRVFFFDRVSRGALQLAKASVDLGAVVVFEPSGVGDPTMFREAWSLSHVIKYSHERLRDIADLDLKRSERDSVLLEIETLGGDGLRFRSRLPKSKTTGWRHVNALTPLVFKDAAGAGDWCTAGVLNSLARAGLSQLRTTTSEELKTALRYGQALASWSCGFDGARGGMYQVDNRAFECQVKWILDGAKNHPPLGETTDVAMVETLERLCPACKNDKLTFSSPRRIALHGKKRRTVRA